MGLGNALAPLAVRETVPERPATGTGVYTTGIQIGSTVAAALAVPLAGLLGGWRGALIALSVVACVIARRVGGARARRRARTSAARAGSSRACRGGRARAWLLVAIFGVDGLRVLRAQRLASRRLRRARLERRLGRAAARRDEPDRDPVLVHHPLAVRPPRRQAAVARRGDARSSPRARSASSRLPGARVPLGAARRHRAGRRVRARDDAPARLRDDARARRGARRADARRRLHDRRGRAVRARRGARRDRVVRRRPLGLRRLRRACSSCSSTCCRARASRRRRVGGYAQAG